jgi:hypothetical protein
MWCGFYTDHTSNSIKEAFPVAGSHRNLGFFLSLSLPQGFNVFNSQLFFIFILFFYLFIFFYTLGVPL